MLEQYSKISHPHPAFSFDPSPNVSDFAGVVLFRWNLWISAYSSPRLMQPHHTVVNGPVTNMPKGGSLRRPLHGYCRHFARHHLKLTSLRDLHTRSLENGEHQSL